MMINQQKVKSKKKGKKSKRNWINTDLANQWQLASKKLGAAAVQKVVRN